MNIKDLEKAMYNDEEFVKYLPLLTKEYWKKAKPNKRLKFFSELQRIISGLDSNFPKNIEMVEFQPGAEQNLYVTEDSVIVNEVLFKRTINPYSVILNYMFELEIVNNFAKALDDEFAKTEKGRRIKINVQESAIREWDNFFSRKNQEFYNQPIVVESVKDASDFTYNLMQYMHKNYGMDEYIGNKLSDLMINSFKDEKVAKKTEENFKIMEARVALRDEEEEKLNAYFDYMSDLDFNEISDTEFFGFFNMKLMNITNEETLFFLFYKFIERELKGFEGLDEILDGFSMGYNENDEVVVTLDGFTFIEQSYMDTFEDLVNFVINVKLSNNLCKEIEDKKFLEEAKQCYDYLNELQNEEGSVYVDYLQNALSYYEYRNFMKENYYNKMVEGIKNNKFFDKGIPYLSKSNYSKYEAYLNFAFGITFDEAKKQQLASLQKQYNEKMGGNR